MRSTDAIRLFGCLNYPKPMDLRHMRGPYSQSELAKIILTNQAAITEWEAGRTQPTPGHLRDILTHYLDWTKRLALPTWDILIAAQPQKRKARPCKN
jgi:predicted transcriptional regulator